MENVVQGWGLEVTGLECPFPCVCVWPACHQQSAVKQSTSVLPGSDSAKTYPRSREVEAGQTVR